jgi:hypothetical protein
MLKFFSALFRVIYIYGKRQLLCVSRIVCIWKTSRGQEGSKGKAMGNLAPETNSRLNEETWSLFLDNISAFYNLFSRFGKHIEL